MKTIDANNYIQPDDLAGLTEVYGGTELTARVIPITVSSDSGIPVIQIKAPPVSDELPPDGTPITIQDVIMQSAVSPGTGQPTRTTVSPPFVNPAATKADSQYYTEGIIYDKKSNQSIAATIQLVEMATGVGITDPFLVQTGSYSAWTDSEPSTVGVKFTAIGHDPQTVSFDKLLTTPDVYLAETGSSVSPLLILAIGGAALLYMKKNKKVGKLQTADIMPIFLLVGGMIGFSVIQKVLTSLGLWGGGDVTNEISDPNSSWKPSYWQQFTSFTYAITEAQAADMASTIYNAFGVLSDDFNAVLGIISQMRTKANVSFLSWEFQKQYGVDLLSFLTDGGGILPWDGLSAKHMTQLITYVHNLPNN